MQYGICKDYTYSEVFMEVLPQKGENVFDFSYIYLFIYLMVAETITFIVVACSQAIKY